MSDNRKYYYLKLKENYFDEDAIVLLESMQDGIASPPCWFVVSRLHSNTVPCDVLSFSFCCTRNDDLKG